MAADSTDPYPDLPRPAAPGRGRVLYWAVLSVVVAGFTLVFLGPLYWMVTGGLKSGQEIAQTPPTLFPRDPQPAQLRRRLDQPGPGASCCSTRSTTPPARWLFQLVFDVAAAYALSKLRPVLGNVILGMMLATLMIPATVLIVPQYVTVIDLPLLHVNLLNSPWAIWLPLGGERLQHLPAQAVLRLDPGGPDGRRRDRRRRAAAHAAGRIVLPMSRPILGVVSIFAVIGGLEGLPLADAGRCRRPGDADRQRRHLRLRRRHPEERAHRRVGHRRVPTIVLFLIFQRNIMSGLTTGGLKG